MVVLQAGVARTGPAPARTPATPPARPPARRRPPRGPALALLLTAAVLLAAHQLRPAPYGDRLTAGPAAASTATALRARAAAVESYDPATGALRWRYARTGHRPLTVVRHAYRDALALWDDGTVTATTTGPHAPAVRWHRTLPASAAWLPAQGGTGVLRPLGHGILAVVTPRQVAAYRVADGDLRWVLPAREGCAFRPARGMRHAGALLLAQPCRDDAWTAQVVAVDDLGRIAPHRTPLGNDLPGARGGHRDPGKGLARPR
ncbi:hypothetical protein [Streptomyces doudnae]|uniref:PQQ-binding-like beta-propeller repeat protein n=2 Tax=Streptomyces TaxID=1883 RepID=A0ABD5ET12_9ACTN|nr:hypothetical protein [Streptomyces sp. DSM 41981]MDT0437781.1 hypothetical protein [Streptomyces sp. DSM 41981]